MIGNRPSLWTFFIIEPDRNASEDARFVKSIADSKRVFMETVLDVGIGDYDSYAKMLDREKVLQDRFPFFPRLTVLGRI